MGQTRAKVDQSLLRVSRVKMRDPGKTLSDINMATSKPVYMYSASRTAKMKFVCKFMHVYF